MITISRHVSKLSGYAPALPTPFADDGNINVAAFEQFCDRQVRAGATALVVCGTTGEAPTLRPAEHSTLIQIAVAAARGRVPVIAGAGSNSTSHAIELTRDAEAAGADATLSVVPYYNKPTQAGLYEHFSAIAQSSGLPMILYDVPSRTVCGLADETIARLAKLPNIIGLKDATGDVTRPTRLRSLWGRTSDFSQAMTRRLWRSFRKAAMAAFQSRPTWCRDCAGICFSPADRGRSPARSAMPFRSRN